MASKLKITVHGKKETRDKEAEHLMRQAARAVWTAFEYPFGGSVDITLTDDGGIRDINRQQRDIDSATDVLSFPMNEFSEGEPPVDVDFCIDPESHLLPLGDVVISVERAKAQGEEYGHGFRRECAYLTVHSMLHLLGYDHMDESVQKKKMRQLEEEIMSVIGLERE